MSRHALSCLTSSTLRRPRCSSLLSAGPPLTLAHTPLTSTRRHHKGRARHFSTASPHQHAASFAHHEGPLFAGQSLAVRLLQPSSLAESPHALHTVTDVPIDAVVRRSTRQEGRMLSTSLSAPFSPEAAEHRQPVPMERSSFPAEFVLAHSGSIAQGMSLGLTLPERNAMRMTALTAWLNTRRQQRARGPTPFAMPPFHTIARSLEEEVEATALFFSSRQPRDDKESAHAAAWHVFCLKTLFDAALQPRMGSQDGSVPDKDTQRCLQHLFSRLMAHPSIPAAVLEALTPIVSRSCHSQHEHWAWKAEVAALCTERRGVWAPEGIAERVAALEREAASEPEALAWVEENAKQRRPHATWREGHLSSSRERHGRVERRDHSPQHEIKGHNQGHKPLTASGQLLVVEATPQETLSRMWSGRYRSLVHTALTTGTDAAKSPLSTLSGADVAVQCYARRLMQQVEERTGTSSTEAFVLLLSHQQWPQGERQRGETHAASACALAEAAASLFCAAQTAQERWAICEGLHGNGGGGLVYKWAQALAASPHALPSVAHVAEIICDDVAHETPTAAQSASMTAALAELLAAEPSPRHVRMVLTAIPSDAHLPFLTHLCATWLSHSNGSGAIDDKEGVAFLTFSVMRLGTLLLDAWHHADAAHDRRYRFTADMAQAVWSAYVPCATALLTRRQASQPPDSTNPAMVTMDALQNNVRDVCVALNYIWDAAVCPQRQQQRRRVRQRTPSATSQWDGLRADMLAELTAATTGPEGVAALGLLHAHQPCPLSRSQDYVAPAPLAMHTVAYARLLHAVLAGPAPPDRPMASGAGTAPRQSFMDSVVFSKLCSASLIPLREVDSTSAGQLLQALDAHASRLWRARELDTHAALAMLRCTAAPRLGCLTPQLTVKFFAAALDAEERTMDGTPANRRPVNWSTETARVLTCLTQAGAVLSRSERAAAMVRFVALVRAKGLPLSVEAHAAVQQGLASTCVSPHGKCREPANEEGNAVFADVEGQYRAWLSEEEHMPLLLRLPDLQLSCARSLLTLGKQKESLKYIPDAHVRGVLQDLLSVPRLAGALHGVPLAQQKDLARHHTALYLCATDPTQSCEAAARISSLHLLSAAPPSMQTELRALWQGWYRAAKPTQVPPRVSSDNDVPGHFDPVFRPVRGQRFVVPLPLSVERERELRAHFMTSGEPSYWSQCCATLKRSYRPALADRFAFSSSGAKPHNVEVSTSYVGVAAALKKRQG